MIGNKTLSVLTAAAIAAGIVPVSEIAAETEHNEQKVRLVIENTVFTEEDGADWYGTLLDEWLPIDENTTAISLFTSALEAHGYTQTGAEYEYITEINGLSGEDGGSMGCWMVTLDNWFTDEGIGAYTVSSGKLENGDEICFRYSLSWGSDLGYDWSGSDTSLSGISVEGGSLTTALEAGQYDYILEPEEGVSAVRITPQVNNPYYRAKVYKNNYTPAENGTDYKFSQAIPVQDGDVIIIGVANSAWMQSNYNNAEESIYRLSIHCQTQTDVMVQEAESYINAIGTVTIHSGEAIRKAREFYDTLTEEQKAQVTNYEILLAAEESYAALTQEPSDVTPEQLRENYLVKMPENPGYGNEWDIIIFSRFGYVDEARKNSYLKSIRETLTDYPDGKFSATRSTASSGVVTALTALGIDAADFNGQNLLQPLADRDYVTKQGVNGAIYALIAFDSHHYAIPTAPEGISQTTREGLIEEILSSQETDGGWTIDTWSGADDGSDADMTAMALQALAPYAKEERVGASIAKALSFLSENQNEKGQFCSYGSFDCESCAQVLTALCALSIDWETDTRVIKDGHNVYDGLMTFYQDDHGFSHSEAGTSNALATTQAYCAAASAYRFRQGMTSLFDMSDITLTVYRPQQEESSKESSKESPSDQSSQSSGITPVNPVQTVKTGSETSVIPVTALSVISALMIIVSLKRSGKKRRS